ncbi:MAG: class I SAM-dependent methyltransferase [Desulfococcaceae bacterium]
MITFDFKRFSIKPGFRILDIGCGSGRHVGGTVCHSKTVTVGTDINPADLRQAQIRLNDLKKMGFCKGTWHLAAADITRLPFPDHYFDLVICSEVLEHIPDHQCAIAEALRVLKPGGNIGISVPRYFPEKICWFLSSAYRNMSGGHIRIYRKKELVNLLESAGLRLWASSYAHSLHTPYWWLKCLLGVERKDCAPVNLWHRFLVWDLMKHPAVTRMADRLFNPLMGKSLVLYLQKIQN